MSDDVSDRKRVVRDDDQFFKRNPDRQHRVRRASPVEIREKRINGGLPTLPPGQGWFLALWNIAQGRRVALFVPNLEDATPTSTRRWRIARSTTPRRLARTCRGQPARRAWPAPW